MAEEQPVEQATSEPSAQADQTQPAATPEEQPPAAAPAEEATPAVTAEAPPTAKPEESKTVKSFPEPERHWFWGTGRRKTSIARVRIRPGDGKFVVNKREYKEYFVAERDRVDVLAPLKAVDVANRVDVFVSVGGGGITGQAGAVVMGVARALKTANPDYGPLLKEQGYLRRDARMVERKKPGQRGARRRFQFSKR